MDKIVFRIRLMRWLRQSASYKLRSIGLHVAGILSAALAGLISAARHLDNGVFRAARFGALKAQPYALAATPKESLVVITSDDMISKSVYVEGNFQFDKIERAIGFLGADFRLKTLIDVGANIGTVCVPAVKRGIAAEAIAVEPEPRNFRVLNANIWLNGLADRIRAHNVALGPDRDGTLEFELSPDNSGDHRIRMSSDAGLYGESRRATICVRATRYDELVPAADPRSQLIWIDVQGFEGHVLAAATGAMRARVPMVLEFWPYGLKRAQGSYERLREALLNYAVFVDLAAKHPTPVTMSGDGLDALYRHIGESGLSTDLLVR